MKDTNDIINTNTNLSIFNSNKSISNEESKNEMFIQNINENIISSLINSDENYFLKNEGKNNYLKYNLYCYSINNTNCNSNNGAKLYNKTYNIISLLKHNPNIDSYKDIIDHLTFDDLLKMFSFILNNIEYFISNYQSYLIINKVISLYNVSNYTFNAARNICEFIKNENIYNFLNSFFSKRIILLIKINSYISTILNFVQKFGFPKNDFIFYEVIQNFPNYSNNRQGCILIQNLFRLGNDIQQQNLLGTILNKCNVLIIDRYGHYILKYLLFKTENGEKYYTLIYNKIVNNLKKYTNNKYSSVVVERLLDSSNETIKREIIENICGNENDVIELLYHCYGNYVLQKIINISKDRYVLGMIHKTIMKNKNCLYGLPYGKKIMKAINVAYTLK